MYVIEHENLNELLKALRDRGYRLVGPTLKDGAIIYDEIASVDDLPRGWTDRQEPASYSVHRRDDDALFGYVVGPHSWKKFLFPPRTKLFSASKTVKGFEIDHEAVEPSTSKPRYAFIGVRSCELHAIAIQDKVFAGGEYVDRTYSSLREDIFILGVNCVQAGGNCFCVSMGTGPKVGNGYDLALTEILSGGAHYFVVEVGSDLGGEVLNEIPHRSAEQIDRGRAAAAVSTAVEQMSKTMDTSNIKELLYENFDHKEWDDVASRCLTCGNCTLVCPTCFCSTVEDVTDLKGEHAERWRRWDSCFTMDFAKVAGGNFRPSAKARYRQWMTHKLASWIDQFGTSGCVGCGRCITWCPVGIDITQEVERIRNSNITKEIEHATRESH